MRYGVLADPWVGTLDDIADEVAFAAAAGIDRYWLAQVWRFDAMGLIPTLAATAPGLEFGTGVAAIYHRHPMTMASQALTTNLLIGGRYTLGLGLMHRPVIEGMFEMSFDHPVRFMREYLDVLLPLLSGLPADASGTQTSYHGVVDVPGASPCPVVLAALGPQMLRLCGHRTDGTITWMTGTRTLRDHIVPTVSMAAHEVGRPAPQIIAMVPVHVTDDPDRGREHAAAALGVYGQMPSYRAMLDREGLAGAEDAVLIGNEAEVRDRISEYQDSGITELVFAVAADEIDRQRTRDFLASVIQ
jgi:F420-dependent oxidoreductase-like protein